MKASIKAQRTGDGFWGYMAGMSAAQRVIAMAYARCATNPDLRMGHVKTARKANWQLLQDMRRMKALP